MTGRLRQRRAQGGAVRPRAVALAARPRRARVLALWRGVAATGCARCGQARTQARRAARVRSNVRRGHAVRVRVAARRDMCVRVCGRTVGRGEVLRYASAASRSRPERGGVARVRGGRGGQAARARGGEEACAPGAARAGTRVGRKEKEGRGKEERKEKGKNIGKEKKKRRGRERKKRERGAGFAPRSWRRSAMRGAGRALVDRRDAQDEGHSEM